MAAILPKNFPQKHSLITCAVFVVASTWGRHEGNVTDFDFQPLLDGIRNCFPAITRNRISINHGATTHKGNILALRVGVILDERFPTFDADGLMALLDADEMTGNDGQSIVKGTFDGKRCEIILLTRQPAAN
jgi:hypothetical protein